MDAIQREGGTVVLSTLAIRASQSALTSVSVDWLSLPALTVPAPDKIEVGRVGERRLASRGVADCRWFPPAPHRTVHAVLPHTAHRRSSPSAFSVPCATAGWGVARRWFR